jgi:hypothetical protein
LKVKITKYKKDGDDTEETEKKLAAAQKKHDSAKKALADYNADIESQTLSGPSTESRVATNGSTSSTGNNKQAGDVKPKKRGGLDLRPRGPQAQTVR